MASAHGVQRERAFTTLLIEEVGEEPPSSEKLDRIDDIVAGIDGYAWRFGIGGEKGVLTVYDYGYALPMDVEVDLHTLDTLQDELRDAGVVRPWVRVGSLLAGRAEQGVMVLVGEPPTEDLEPFLEYSDTTRYYRFPTLTA